MGLDICKRILFGLIDLVVFDVGVKSMVGVGVVCVQVDVGDLVLFVGCLDYGFELGCGMVGLVIVVCMLFGFVIMVYRCQLFVCFSDGYFINQIFIVRKFVNLVF